MITKKWLYTLLLVVVVVLLSVGSTNPLNASTQADIGGFLFAWSGVKYLQQNTAFHRGIEAIDVTTTGETKGPFDILAPKDGVVYDFFDLYNALGDGTDCQPDPGESYENYSNYVILGHGPEENGKFQSYTLYYHLERSSVSGALGVTREQNEKNPISVRVGQKIGVAGKTGGAGGMIHLHMEMTDLTPNLSEKRQFSCNGERRIAPFGSFLQNQVPIGFEENGSEWPLLNGGTGTLDDPSSFNWQGIANVNLSGGTNFRQCADGDRVRLYNHIDYGGECIAMIATDQTANIPDGFHVSSVYLSGEFVNDKLSLTLYDERDRGENSSSVRALVLFKSFPDLTEIGYQSGGSWNDKVLSVHNEWHGANWLTEMSIADNPPLGTDIHVVVDDPGDHDALRVCFNGENCQETGATELSYYWPTYLEEEGSYAITVERRLLSHNQDWNNADRMEFAYYLNKHSEFTHCSLVVNGATLTSNGECLGVIEDVADLMPVHWENRPDLQVCAVGNMMAWVYDGVRDPHGNYQGVPKVVESESCMNVGSNVSSIDLMDASADPPPNPSREFEVDEHTVHLMHFNGNTTDEVTGMSASVGSGVSQVSGVFGTQAYRFPNPTDGPGLTYPSINACPMTFEAWVNRGTGGAFRIAGQKGLWILSADGNKPKIEIWHPTGSVWVTSYEAMLENTWHYIMWTYDCDGQVVLYMDQKYVGSVTIDQPPWSNNYSALEIGAVEGIYRFNGDIEEVRISNTVRVPEPPRPVQPPQANMSASPTSGIAPLDVDFFDQSLGDVTDWLWEFGDGATSTVQNPSHTYNISGNYTVTLTVSNEDGSDSFTWPNMIQVEDSPTVPEIPANFHVCDSTQGSITICWDDVSDEDGYRVFRWNGVEFLLWATVPADQTSYTDLNLDCNSGFSYQVDAFNNEGESGRSPFISGFTDICSPPEYAGHTIDDDANGSSDGNNDGIIDAGEDIELYVDLMNPGEGTVPWVNAVLVTADPYVSVLGYPGRDYPEIGPGDTVQNNSAWEFSVEPDTPDGHIVSFCLDPIAARDSGPWSDCFDIPVSNQSEPNPGGVLVSSTSGGSVDNVSFADEDILLHEFGTGAWSKYFDGSDVGLKTADIDAVHLMGDESILISLLAPYSVPGVGKVDDSDIVRFVPESIGEDTRGHFELFFDGSDVGLSTSGEDVNAVAVLLNEANEVDKILLSVYGRAKVNGLSGKYNDEDILAFTPEKLGTDTKGSWALYFDGSDVRLTASSEDIFGLWVDDEVDEDLDDIYLVTQGNFSVTDLRGKKSTAFICSPMSLGTNTSCNFSSYWNGGAYGFGRELTNAFSRTN